VMAGHSAFLSFDGPVQVIGPTGVLVAPASVALLRAQAGRTPTDINHHRDSRFRALRHVCDRNETTVGANRSEIVTDCGGAGHGGNGVFLADRGP